LRGNFNHKGMPLARRSLISLTQRRKGAKKFLIFAPSREMNFYSPAFRPVNFIQAVAAWVPVCAGLFL
jgi:hypothetical protein